MEAGQDEKNNELNQRRKYPVEALVKLEALSTVSMNSSPAC